MPEPRGNRANRIWNRESARGGARISICPRECLEKGGQRRHRSRSEDGGKKN